MKKLLLTIGTVCLLLVGSTAKAEMPSKMFRLHLFTNVIEVGVGEIHREGSPDDDYGGLEVGAGMSRFGLGFAGTLGRGFVLGGRVALGQEADNWHPGADGEHFLWSVVPYLEYVFLNTRVRPFIKAMTGFEGAQYGNNAGFWGFVIGGGGGIHIFLRANVSIDIDFDLAMRLGSGDDGGPNPDPGNDYSHWRFKFATLFGLSAWI